LWINRQDAKNAKTVFNRRSSLCLFPGVPGVLAVDSQLLSSNYSRHAAIHAAIESACAFGEDLHARPSACVLGFDLKDRVILVVANCHQRVEDRLFGCRVSVDRLKEIQLVFGILFRHIYSLYVNSVRIEIHATQKSPLEKKRRALFIEHRRQHIAYARRAAIEDNCCGRKE
jgi:hypothetical protein